MRERICRFVALLMMCPAPAAISDNSAIEQLIEKIEARRTQYDVAAVGLALVRGDAVLFSGGLGVLDLKADVPVSADTQFRLGSITKSFTGLTALRLTRTRRDVLEVSANAVITDVLKDPFAGAPVTLQSLLEHTAGLSDLSRAEFDFQGEHVSFVEAIAVAPGTRILKWPANRHSSYSNAGYGIAGYMLETISKKPYETLVHEQVLAPLNMNASGFHPVDDGPTLAVGYDSDGVTPIPYWHMLYRSFGGLNSTPRDMARFLSALTTAGNSDSDWLSLSERRRFENPHTTLAASTGLEYGYGLGNYHWFRKGTRFHGHGGDADGYLSHYGYNHATGMGYFVVITAFKHKPLKDMRRHLEDFIVAQANEIPKKTRSLKPAQLKQWLGTYRPVTKRFGGPGPGSAALEIKLVKGQLETVYNDVRNTLIPVTDTHFRRSWQPDATYAFIVDGNDTYLQGDLGNFKKTGTRRR